MPHPRSHSVREAVNESEIHAALAAATKGYGGVIRFARRTRLTYEYVQMMLYGSRRVSVEVARHLGYHLRWVKYEKE